MTRKIASFFPLLLVPMLFTTTRAGGKMDAYIMALNDAEEKVTALANAVPEEKYAWRPGEGVRSVGEVYMHIVNANCFIPTLIGVNPPEGFSEETEKKVTEKADIIAWLKKSLAHAREVINTVSDENLAKKADFFGTETTGEGVLMILVTHVHEHLGQSIAYARTNGVVPPWSAKQKQE
jgi:uncharacterized damage-inducible protein DinB